MLRLKLSLLGSSGLLLLSFMLLLSIATGPVRLPLSESLHALLSLPSHANDLSTQQLIIQTIRLPRTLLCISVGAILALAGAVLQGLFRNPLADPGIIGVSGGAALGAGLSIVLLPAGVSLAGLSIAGFSLGWLSLGYTALCAFLCGMLTTLLVYRIGRTPFGTSVNMMLLAGVAIGAIAFSGLGLLSYLADDQQLRDLSLWQMGSLAGARWDTLLLSSLTLLVLLVGFYRQAPALNALLLGESEARHLGVNVERLKRRLIIGCAVGIGVSVSVSGMIGFIGLIVPHLVRMLCGPDYRNLLPLSALCGAILLLLADLLARQLAAPAEIPVGIITALLGAPFFIWLLIQQKRSST